MSSKKLLKIFVLIMLVQLPLLALAEEGDDHDLELFGFDAEELLAFVSAHLAAALALLTLIAYLRTKRTRLLFVVLAFALFSLRLYMEASELFIEEIIWLGPVSALLDFAILLSFFFGIIKK